MVPDNKMEFMMADMQQDKMATAHAGGADHPVTHVLDLIHRLFSGGPSDVGDNPAEARGPSADPPPEIGTADTLRDFTNAALEQHVQSRKTEDDQVVLEDKRRVKILLQTQLEQGMWNAILTRISAAAERGETEFLLLKFPSDLCLDGGRKIRVGEAGWEDTLQGEAREIAVRYTAELKPKGLRLDARTMEYRAGLPGDIGLFVNWRI